MTPRQLIHDLGLLYGEGKVPDDFEKLIREIVKYTNMPDKNRQIFLDCYFSNSKSLREIEDKYNVPKKTINNIRQEIITRIKGDIEFDEVMAVLTIAENKNLLKTKTKPKQNKHTQSKSAAKKINMADNICTIDFTKSASKPASSSTQTAQDTASLPEQKLPESSPTQNTEQNICTERIEDWKKIIRSIFEDTLCQNNKYSRSDAESIFETFIDTLSILSNNNTQENELAMFVFSDHSLEYDIGYKAAYGHAFDEGYNAAYEDAYQDAYSKAYASGFNKMHDISDAKINDLVKEYEAEIAALKDKLQKDTQLQITASDTLKSEPESEKPVSELTTETESANSVPKGSRWTTDDVPLYMVSMPTRALASLNRAGYRTIRDVISVGPERIQKCYGMGTKTYNDLARILTTEFKQYSSKWQQ